jgi:hypothetical protein
LVLFFCVWPRAFGGRDLGRILGGAPALPVLAAGVGPLLLALWVVWRGCYSALYPILAGVIGGPAAAALVISMPEPHGAGLPSPSPAQ